MKKLYPLLILWLIGFQVFANVPAVVVPIGKSSLDCATITQTSSPGTSNQTVCLNTPIMVITYTVANGGTGATVSGLPPGVTSSFSVGTFSISGTPTAAGIYNYTVTTIGGDCAPASLTGTITVNPNATMQLSSSAPTANQTVCVNTPIVPIVYSVGNGATGATVMGLPSGITGVFNAATQTMTLSGAPTVSGTFNYMVTTSGGCSSASLAGVIIVSPNVTLTLTSPISTINQVVCLGTQIVSVVFLAGSGATNATVTGLPLGCTGTFNPSLLSYTISGTPVTDGIFSYTVTTTGGCATNSMSGTLSVVSGVAMNLTSTASGSSVTFDWNEVPGASGYLYNYSINGGALVNGVIPFPSTTEFTLSSLPANSTVVFNVSAQGVSCANATLTTEVLSARAFEKVPMVAYPNPVTDVLYLKADRVFSKVQVFNTLGKLMAELQLQSENPAVDMSAFAPGVYFVRATADETQQTFSIVKQ